MNLMTAQSEIVRMKRELGVRNFKALNGSYYRTKKSQRELITSTCGKKISQAHFLRECVRFQGVKDAFRKEANSKVRVRRSYSKPFRYGDLNQRISDGRCGIAQALRARKAIIRQAVSDSIKHPAGQSTINIEMVETPEEVYYTSRTEKGEQYSSRCTFRKTDLIVNVGLPHKWYSRVYKKGFSTVDGLFNLDISTPLRNQPEGVEVRAAKFLYPGRGCSYHVMDGFIAFAEEFSFHGKTLKSSIKGVAKKARISELLKARPSEIIARALKSSVKVGVRDSYKAGNCQWGTLDFCRRHNLDPKSKIPLEELAALAQKEPRAEVLTVLAMKLAD